MSELAEPIPEESLSNERLSSVARHLFDANVDHVHSAEGRDRCGRAFHVRMLTMETKSGRYEILENILGDEFRLNFIGEDNVAWPRMTVDQAISSDLAVKLREGTPLLDHDTQARSAELAALLSARGNPADAA